MKIRTKTLSLVQNLEIILSWSRFGWEFFRQSHLGPVLFTQTNVTLTNDQLDICLPGKMYSDIPLTNSTQSRVCAPTISALYKRINIIYLDQISSSWASDLEKIFNLLGTWFIDPNHADNAQIIQQSDDEFLKNSNI